MKQKINKLAQWILSIISSSSSIYKYGIPTVLETDGNPCDHCKYNNQKGNICGFCEKNLALNQYYR